MFDAHITIGNILETVTIFAGFVYFIFELKQKLGILSVNYEEFFKQFSNLEKDVKELSRAVNQIALQDQRLKMLESQFLDIQDTIKSHVEKSNEHMARTNEYMLQTKSCDTCVAYKPRAARKKIK